MRQYGIPPSSPASSPAESLLAPDQTRAFATALFDGLTGWVNFRAFQEPGGGAAQNEWCEIGPALADYVVDFAQRCALAGKGAFLTPAPMREHGGTHIADIACFPWLSVDLDKGNTDQHLDTLRARIGEPSLVVLSGGTSEGALTAKRHVYYRLASPMPGGSKEAAVPYTEMRKGLAALCGKNEGDSTVAGNANQVLRIAGSAHQKGEPKSVTLVAHNPHAAYAVENLRKILVIRRSDPPTNVIPFSFDFNNDRSTHPIDDLRDAEILCEGKSGITRWNAFNELAGKEIQDAWAHRKTLAEAKKYVLGWVRRSFERPGDWTDGKAAREFEALVELHIKNHGPLPAFVPPIMSPAASDDFDIDVWSIDRFSSPAPDRQWLVADLIPMGTAGVFAAPGDAGKSMLSLWLAYVVGCTPAPTMTADCPAGMSDTPRFFGQPVVARGAAVVLTAEDDAAEVHRRIQTLDTAGLRKRGKQRVYVVPMPSAGGARAIIQDSHTGVVATPFWRTLRAKLAAIPDLKLVVIDP